MEAAYAGDNPKIRRSLAILGAKCDDVVDEAFSKDIDAFCVQFVVLPGFSMRKYREAKYPDDPLIYSLLAGEYEDDSSDCDNNLHELCLNDKLLDIFLKWYMNQNVPLFMERVEAAIEWSYELIALILDNSEESSSSSRKRRKRKREDDRKAAYEHVKKRPKYKSEDE